MDDSAEATASVDSNPPLRVAVMTMVRDEAEVLPRWLAHYGGELGTENLIVLDDNTADGSTDALPCTHYRLPPPPWKAGWAKTRRQLVNGLARGLLACNDVVIYTDADEFLVADPRVHAGLRDYLRTRADAEVVAPFAVEVIHHTGLEPPLDPARGVLAQRSYVKYAPAMCKPLVKRTNSRWESAFHASSSPFCVDPDLWLFHLKFADEDQLRLTSERRAELHRVENRGHPLSFWARPADEVVSKLAEWTEGIGEVAELNPAEIDLTDLVQEDDAGTWRADASQVRSLDTSPLRRLPARFHAAF